MSLICPCPCRSHTPIPPANLQEVGGAVPLYGSEEEEDWGQGANDMDDDDFDDEVEVRVYLY